MSKSKTLTNRTTSNTLTYADLDARYLQSSNSLSYTDLDARYLKAGNSQIVDQILNGNLNITDSQTVNQNVLILGDLSTKGNIWLGDTSTDNTTFNGNISHPSGRFSFGNGLINNSLSAGVATIGAMNCTGNATLGGNNTHTLTVNAKILGSKPLEYSSATGVTFNNNTLVPKQYVDNKFTDNNIVIGTSSADSLTINSTITGNPNPTIGLRINGQAYFNNLPPAIPSIPTSDSHASSKLYVDRQSSIAQYSNNTVIKNNLLTPPVFLGTDQVFYLNFPQLETPNALMLGCSCYLRIDFLCIYTNPYTLTNGVINNMTHISQMKISSIYHCQISPLTANDFFKLMDTRSVLTSTTDTTGTVKLSDQYTISGSPGTENFKFTPIKLQKSRNATTGVVRLKLLMGNPNTGVSTPATTAFVSQLAYTARVLSASSNIPSTDNVQLLATTDTRVDVQNYPFFTTF